MVLYRHHIIHDFWHQISIILYSLQSSITWIPLWSLKMQQRTYNNKQKKMSYYQYWKWTFNCHYHVYINSTVFGLPTKCDKTCCSKRNLPTESHWKTTYSILQIPKYLKCLLGHVAFILPFVILYRNECYSTPC